VRGRDAAATPFIEFAGPRLRGPWRRSLTPCPKFEPRRGDEAEAVAQVAMAQVLDETAHRLGDNYPYFHPLYAADG